MIGRLFNEVMENIDDLIFGPSKKEKEDAAVVLQKYIRRHQTQKKYKVDTLPESELTNYPTFILGNDPDINGLDEYRSNEKTCLIGTSGLRSWLLACELSNGRKTTKLIVVDNSRNVNNFWHSMQAYIQTKSSSAEFLSGLNEMLISKGKLFGQEAKVPEAIRFDSFVTKLFDIHGFNHAKSILINAVILKQSWTHQETFAKIKNILEEIKIDRVFMYASNIVAYTVDVSLQNSILVNIQKIAPDVCIHTDMIQGMPKNYYFIRDHDPEDVRKKIFTHACQHDANDLWQKEVDMLEAVRQKTDKQLQQLVLAMQRINLPEDTSSPSSSAWSPQLDYSRLFSQSHQVPHHQLFNKIKSIAEDKNILKQVRPLLESIQHKEYSRALRIAANYPSGFDFAEAILLYKVDLEININEQAGESQNAAIHYAVKKENLKLYKLLVLHGADDMKENLEGLVPKEWAIKQTPESHLERRAF